MRSRGRISGIAAHLSVIENEQAYLRPQEANPEAQVGSSRSNITTMTCDNAYRGDIADCPRLIPLLGRGVALGRRDRST
jgi:hypothetical protein